MPAVPTWHAHLPRLPADSGSTRQMHSILHSHRLSPSLAIEIVVERSAAQRAATPATSSSAVPKLPDHITYATACMHYNPAQTRCMEITQRKHSTPSRMAVTCGRRVRQAQAGPPSCELLPSACMCPERATSHRELCRAAGNSVMALADVAAVAGPHTCELVGKTPKSARHDHWLTQQCDG